GLTGSTSFTWNVTNVDRPPSITPIANRTDAEGSSISLAAIASDPDGDALAFSATGLPAGLGIDPATGLISGTLTYTSAAVRSVTVTVVAGGVSASTSFTWTVTNVDRAPVVTAIGNRTDAENSTISLPASATDPDGDAVTFTAIGLPPGLAIDSASGL